MKATVQIHPVDKTRRSYLKTNFTFKQSLSKCPCFVLLTNHLWDLWHLLVSLYLGAMLRHRWGSGVLNIIVHKIIVLNSITPRLQLLSINEVLQHEYFSPLIQNVRNPAVQLLKTKFAIIIRPYNVQ